MPRLTRALAIILFFIVMCIGSVAVTRADSYTIINLGTLPGDSFSGAVDVNNSGQVVGGSGGRSSGAFIYNNGMLQDLGTLGGGLTSALAINDLGQVVGSSYTASGPPHAFLYSNGVMQDIGTLPSHDKSSAHDINNLGQIVGRSSDQAEGQVRAFLYSNGVMQNLGTLGGSTSVAFGINELGQVVGYSKTSTGDDRPFLYNNGVMQDLGTLSGMFSYANAINDLGIIVGSSTSSSGHRHAFLYRGGVMTDLGTLPGDKASEALSINNLGQIVGRSDCFCVSEPFIERPFLYSDGMMQDLNDLIPSGSGWVLSAAFSINDVGQIAGQGLFNGQQRAFLLTPNQTTDAVPEPTTMILLSTGLAGVVAMRRRRKTK